MTSIVCPGLPALSPVVLASLENGAQMPVTIGVDLHKASHTTAALDEQGQLLDRQWVPATLKGHQLLCQRKDGTHALLSARISSTVRLAGPTNPGFVSP
jgi:hypothetical protein